VVRDSSDRQNCLHTLAETATYIMALCTAKSCRRMWPN